MTSVVISNRRTFTIHCRQRGGVEITDGNNKSGGNLRTAGGKQLAWINVTGQETCYLRFASVSRSDDDGKACWPFVEASDDGLLALRRAERTVRTLEAVPATECVEYVVLGAGGQPLLDPVIIIDPT